MRGLGLTSLLQDLAGPFVVVFALLTQLGDLWLLALVTVSAYWLDARAPLVGPGLDRRRSAHVLALLVLAMALLVTLKPLFGYVRPIGFDAPPTFPFLPDTLHAAYVSIASAEGFGFPSGHALGSTIVWGGLAWAVRVGRVRRRVALAAGIVVVVSLSRLVLGVHYLIDVVAGVLGGLVVLGVALRWLRTPLSVLALATGVAVVGVALGVLGLLATGITHDLAAVTGLCVGVTAVWYALGDELLAAPTHRGGLATLGIGAFVVAPVLGATALSSHSLWFGAVLAAIGGTLVVALPLVGERVAAARAS